jgi:hypothetical protein
MQVITYCKIYELSLCYYEYFGKGEELKRVSARTSRDGIGTWTFDIRTGCVVAELVSSILVNLIYYFGYMLSNSPNYKQRIS